MAKPARPAAPRSPLMDRLDELERKLGKGPTFSRTDFALMLKPGAPAWLVYTARYGEGRDRADADRLVGELVALRARVKLPDAFAPPKEDG